ncbi:uncharacterized protein LOC114805381 [Zeugodacus cucurbitae]|uniref:uncharacterized protein LOC114805381 n=1 Tax=Zeugodacus cucurbitae TaxID=28588 RepID=UPI0023D8F404|nr:uncharacterized protein LOC114805381 [Zeugodacus cucurbitae]
MVTDLDRPRCLKHVANHLKCESKKVSSKLYDNLDPQVKHFVIAFHLEIRFQYHKKKTGELKYTIKYFRDDEMRYIITFYNIILLNMLSAGAREELDKSCPQVINIEWNDVCHGTITSEIKLKYKDQMTSIGTPFKVLVSTSIPGFLVTFYDSFLLTCTTLRIDKNLVATCAKNGNYTIKPSMVYCFNYYLYYVTELMEVCFDPADYNLLAVPFKFVALHYAYTPPLEGGPIALDITPKWLLYVIVAMLVWVT